MTNVIFFVGLVVGLAVCYALFAYTIAEFDYHGKSKRPAELKKFKEAAVEKPF